jgi:hypothetical protein
MLALLNQRQAAAIFTSRPERAVLRTARAVNGAPTNGMKLIEAKPSGLRRL